MYFPSDMNFQYFFFDTYIGYFLQALPFALFLGTLYGVIKRRKNPKLKLKEIILPCLFCSYLTGLILLTIGLDLMHIFYYYLLYHQESGTSIILFNGSFDFSLDFYQDLSAEMIANFLMFVPFGIMQPCTHQKSKWPHLILKGFIMVICIELIQPVFGRSFDLNDVILNTLGIIIGSVISLLIKKYFARKKVKNERKSI